MTNKTYFTNLEDQLSKIAFKKRELIKEKQRLHDLKMEFHEGNKEGISAKDFRKIESKIDIIENEISLLMTEKQQLEVRRNRERLEAQQEIDFS